MVVYRLLSKTLDVCSKLEGFPTIVEESKNMGLMIYIHSTCNRVDKKKQIIVAVQANFLENTKYYP